MKVQKKIQCPYCEKSAWHEESAKTRKPDTARYGCANGHFFALPVQSVEVK